MSQAIDYQSGFTDAWTTTVGFIPKLLAFLAVLIIGWIIAKAIARVTRKLLVKVNYDHTIARTGVTDAIRNPNFSATDLTSKVVYYVLMLFVLMTAFRTFGPNPISDYLTQVAAYLPNVIVAVVIMVLAVAIARGVRGIVEQSLGGLSYARNLATGVSALIIVFGAFAALDQLQIAQNVVNGVLYAALAAAVGVIVVAVGGGGIKTMSDRWEKAAQRWDIEKPKLQAVSQRAAAAKADQAQRIKQPPAMPAPQAPTDVPQAPAGVVPGFDEPVYTGYPQPRPPYTTNEPPPPPSGSFQYPPPPTA